MTRKSSIQLEKVLKGAANHWRIDILCLVSANPGLSLDQIVEKLKGNQKTLSVHLLKLAQAGLIEKKYQGATVLHFLTVQGKKIYSFLKTF